MCIDCGSYIVDSLLGDLYEGAEDEEAAVRAAVAAVQTYPEKYNLSLPRDEPL